MEQYLVAAGFVLVLVGIALIMVGGLAGAKGETHVAVGGFIGPIPFGFANSPTMMKVLVAFMIAIFVFLFLVPYLMRAAYG